MEDEYGFEYYSDEDRESAVDFDVSDMLHLRCPNQCMTIHYRNSAEGRKELKCFCRRSKRCPRCGEKWIVEGENLVQSHGRFLSGILETVGGKLREEAGIVDKTE